EDELQRRAEGRRARDADEVHDLLRWLGDLTVDEVAERCEPDADAEALLAALQKERRAARVRVAGREAWIAVEDAGLYRDALGVVPPQGIPAVFLAEGDEAVGTLLARWARTHGPFGTPEIASRFGLTVSQTRLGLDHLEQQDR